jgi:Protein of unknown function (DUF3102)
MDIRPTTDLTQDIAASNSLADLAARIRAEHEAVAAFMKKGLERAICAGELLLEAKAQLNHGEWLPWLAEHCQIPERTATHYMRLARHADEIGNVADLTVRGALELLAPEDGRGIVTGVGMHPYAERGVDLYETPAPATRALLAAERFGDGAIWEIANGRGAISRVLRLAGHRVVATDLVDYGIEDARGGVDFLAQASAPEGVTTILTNPPFMYADEFVRHALTLVPRVVFLLRLAFVAGVGRSDILEGGQLARVYVFRNRLMFHRDGWQGSRTNNSALEFAWFVWSRDHRGPIELRRISWEADEAPPAGESWTDMWARPFDHSKLDAGAPPDDPACDLSDCSRRAAS